MANQQLEEQYRQIEEKLKKSGITFKPIRGLESDLTLEALPITEGALLIATDTGRMWLDTQTRRVPLAGGGVNLLYGKALVLNRQDSYGYYIFNPSTDLEDSNAKTNVGDLILNSDGKFYRIMSIDNNKYLHCSLFRVNTGAAIWYIALENIYKSTDGNYHFQYSDILNENAALKNNDIIIDLKSGNFYKIYSLIGADITCELMSVSGGSGSGSGGVSAMTPAKQPKIELFPQTVSNGGSCKVSFTCYSDTLDEVPVFNMLPMIIELYRVNDDGTLVYPRYDQIQVDCIHGVPKEIEIGPLLKTSARTWVTYTISNAESLKDIMTPLGYSYLENSSYKNLLGAKVSMTDLSLSWSNSGINNNNYFTDTISNIILNISQIGNRLVRFYFDDFLIFQKRIEENVIQSTIDVPSINANTRILNEDGSFSGQTLLTLFTHGTHTLKADLSFIDEKGNITETTKPITKEIALLKENKSLIWVGELEQEYEEYDTIVIPYRVYVPGAVGENKVSYYKNGANYNEGEYTLVSNNSPSWTIWRISNLEADANDVYSISVGDTAENQVVRDFHFTILKDKRQMGEVSDAVESISAKGRSNNSSLKNKLTLKNGKNVIFNNFNWYNNGWIAESDNKNVALKISNGASVKIPIGAQDLGPNNAKTFEFRMKITNVSDYSSIVSKYARYEFKPEPGDPRPEWDDKLIFEEFKKQRQDGIKSYDLYLTHKLPELQLSNPNIPSYDDLSLNRTESEYNLDHAVILYKDESASTTNIPAICFGPQDGFFSDGTSAASVNFVEKEIFTVTLVYTGGNPNNAGNNSLIKIYLNGVLTGVSRSDKENIWTIGKNEDSGIEIKSDSCDIFLYNLRVYNHALTTEQILKNYAYDNLFLKEWDFASKGSVPKTDYSALSQFSYQAMNTYNISPEVKSGKEEPIMPYIVFTTDDSLSGKGNLPWYKTETNGESHYEKQITMEFVNPTLDLMYKNGDLEGLAKEAGYKSDDKETAVEKYYKDHCPSWIAEDIDLGVQGTSSEFYPRRNYKAKTKVKRTTGSINSITQEIDGISYNYEDEQTKSFTRMTLNKGPFEETYKKWVEEGKDEKARKESSLPFEFFKFDNPEVGTSKFTLKIDFMESSGSYNMGLANMVNNAYAQHPLDYYQSRHVLVNKISHPGEEKVLDYSTMIYDENSYYWYINHKGNWKYALNNNETHDNLNKDFKGNIFITSTESLQKGPIALSSEAQNKVLCCLDKTGGDVGTAGTFAYFKDQSKLSNEDATSFVDKYYNKLFDYKEGSVELKEITQTEQPNFNNYRTSVQGFPTLAFHKTKSMDKANEDPIFIGRYNMLVDKGADEVYGFKYSANQRYIKDNPELKKVAECWEFENNQRGYCSFRDPWNRYDLSFTPDEDASEDEKYTKYGAPVVADSFEYRYHANSDDLDILTLLNVRNSDAKSIVNTYNNLGANISNIDEGRTALLDLYKNWEKAVKWVWKTCTDAKINVDNGILEEIPNLGNYEYIDVAEKIYEVGKYYSENIESTAQDRKELDYNEFDAEKIYYRLNEKGKYVGIKLTDDPNKLYTPNKFYLKSPLDENTYFLSTETTFNADETYYIIKEKYILITEQDNITLEEKKDNYYVLYENQYRRYSALSDREKEILGEEPDFYKSLIQDFPWKLPEEKKIGNKYYNYDTKEYRLQKFNTELTEHFNLEYLVTYFIITEVLECYDSRGKNCMMASWGPMTEGGDYIWFPIFYDLDTQLGINNTGIPSFDYDIDATEQGAFSTNDSVLWNNLYLTKRSAIVEKYNQLKGSPSSTFVGKRASAGNGVLDNPPFESVDKIEKFYSGSPEVYTSSSMKGYRPLLAINSDEEYKYIEPTSDIEVSSSPTTNEKIYTISGDNKIAKAPVIRGYLGSSANAATPKLAQLGDNWFYALQGNRSMQRQQFLTNRFNYIDSWLGTGEYVRAADFRIQSRISANNSDNTSDRWVAGASQGSLTSLNINQPYFSRKLVPGEQYDSSKIYYQKITPKTKKDGLILDKYYYSTEEEWNEKINNEELYIEQSEKEGTKTHMFDGEYWISMTPVRNMYVTVGTDAANFPSEKYEGNQPVKFKTSNLRQGVQNSPNYKEQLYYIYGLHQMKSLGDLSKLYFQEFAITGAASKMVDLRLGYDGLDESGNEYQNHGVNNWGINGSGDNLPLLRYVNLSNIQFKDDTNVFNFTGCDKLQNFRAIGSNIAGVKFAEGVSLHTLHLPETITDLSLIEARLLTDLIETYHYPQLSANGEDLIAEQGLYIKNLTDLNLSQEDIPVTKLTGLNIQGGGLGYNSYVLLKKFVKSCLNDSSKISRKLKMTDVQWSPFTLVLSEDTEDQNKYKYFVDNNHYQLEEYSEDIHGKWESLAKNNRLYYIDRSYWNTESYYNELNRIKDFDLFKEVSGQTLDSQGIFIDYENGRGQIPTISGTVFINNEDEIDESEIYKILQTKFPNLRIFFGGPVKKGISARFILVDENNVETLIGTEKLSKEDLLQGEFFTNPLERKESVFSGILIDGDNQSMDFIGWGNIQNNKYIRLDEDFSYYSDKIICSYDIKWVNLLNQTSIQNWRKWCQENVATIPEGESKEFTFQAIRRYHYYQTTFHGYGSQSPITYSIKYNDPILAPSPLDFIPYKPDNDLTGSEIDYTWKFAGWSTNSLGSIVNVDLTKYRSTEDYNFYPVFEKIKCIDNPLPQEYFDLKYNGRRETKKSAIDGTPISNIEGYTIAFKESYVPLLKGKITIPTTWTIKDEKNGEQKYPIVSIGIPTDHSKTSQYEISDIFFERDCTICNIESSTFASWKFSRIHFAPSIKEIGSRVFLNNTELETIDFSDTNIEYIGTAAFTQCFSGNFSAPLHFGGKLRAIEPSDSANPYGIMNGITRNTTFAGGLVIGGPGDPSQLLTRGTLINNVFIRYTSSGFDNITIYCEESDKLAFENLIKASNNPFAAANPSNPVYTIITTTTGAK